MKTNAGTAVPAHLQPLDTALRQLKVYSRTLEIPVQKYLREFINPARAALTTHVNNPQELIRQVKGIYAMLYPFMLQKQLQNGGEKAPQSLPLQIEAFVSLMPNFGRDAEQNIESIMEVLAECPKSIKQLQALCDFYNKYPIDTMSISFYTFITFIGSYAHSLGVTAPLDRHTNKFNIVSPSTGQAIPTTTKVSIAEPQLRTLLFLTANVIAACPDTEADDFIVNLLYSLADLKQPAKRRRILSEIYNAPDYLDHLQTLIPYQHDDNVQRFEKMLSLIKATAPTATIAYQKALMIMYYYANDRSIAGAAIRRIRVIAEREFDDIELAHFDRLVKQNSDLHTLSLTRPSNIQARHIRYSNQPLGITFDRFCARAAHLCYQAGAGLYRICLQIINNIISLLRRNPRPVIAPPSPQVVEAHSTVHRKTSKRFFAEVFRRSTKSLSTTTGLSLSPVASPATIVII